MLKSMLCLWPLVPLWSRLVINSQHDPFSHHFPAHRSALTWSSTAVSLPELLRSDSPGCVMTAVFKPRPRIAQSVSFQHPVMRLTEHGGRPRVWDRTDGVVHVAESLITSSGRFTSINIQRCSAERWNRRCVFSHQRSFLLSPTGATAPSVATVYPQCSTVAPRHVELLWSVNILKYLYKLSPPQLFSFASD